MKSQTFRQLLAVLGSIVVGIGSSATVKAQQRVHGCVPDYVRQLSMVPVGRLDTTKQLTLGLGLSLHNPTRLTSLLSQLYNPGSPDFHHWLTPLQFIAQFSPSQTDYQSVITWAEQNGFSIVKTYPDRLLVDVSGTVGDIERAFHLDMMVYNRRHNAGTFFAPDSDPTINLTVPIVHISGLRSDITPVSHTKIISPQTVKPVPATGTGSGPGQYYVSADLRAAYAPGVSLNGSGQTVGLLQFSGFTQSDITTYESQTGLPNVPLSTVLVDGPTVFLLGPPIISRRKSLWILKWRSPWHLDSHKWSFTKRLTLETLKDTMKISSTK